MRRRMSDCPVSSMWKKGERFQFSAASPPRLVRPYSRTSTSSGRSRFHRKTRPSWTGCNVSATTSARQIGKPVAASRSQTPSNRSGSAAPASPALVTQDTMSAVDSKLTSESIQGGARASPLQQRFQFPPERPGQFLVFERIGGIGDQEPELRAGIVRPALVFHAEELL